MIRRLAAAIPGKLNLGLEIVGRRPDGYHELVTILQTVSLFDRCEWTPTGRPFEYVGPPGIEPDADLTLRALRGADDFDTWTGRLMLHKGIPIAAGMGGGSADAAFALRLAHPRATADELHARAARLGADVPFFLEGGTALASGIGTDLFALPSLRMWIIVLAPPLAIPDKTRALYAGLVPGDFSTGTEVHQIAEALSAGQLPRQLPNAFARQVLAFPEVQRIRNLLIRAGASPLAVSGAGPSMFALTPSYRRAATLAARLPKDAGTITLGRSIARRGHEPSSRAIARALRAGIAGAEG